MNTKEITVAGKTINIAYNYATEIAFKDLTDCDINDLMEEIHQSFKSKRDPDREKVICLILAASMAYCQWKHEEPVITDHILMMEMTPQEMGIAILEIITLRGQFYKIPSDEPAEKQEGNKSKNS